MLDQQIVSSLARLADVLESRGDDYQTGDVFTVIQETARMLNTSPLKVIEQMITLKLARLKNQPESHSQDNLIDIAGYAILGYTWLVANQ